MDLWDGADFRLKPHNHRQNISLTLLFGKATNVTVSLGRGELAVWKYKFGSGLLEKDFTLDRMNREDATLKEKPITHEPTSLHWSEVHTVVADPMSAWLVEEGPLAPPGMERCYSVNHRLEMSNAGLYCPLSPVSLRLFEKFFVTTAFLKQ